MHTLLLADDSITVQRVIALTFAEEPVHVVAVSDGQQAMDRIAVQRPDVILAATTLSQVSGYDLAQFVRSKAETQGVPVLLLSGAFETVDEAKLKASGANGVIEKPVEPIAVIARVRELLGLKSAPKPAPGGRLVTSAEGPAEKKPAVPSAGAASTTKSTPSNWEQLREQSGLGADTRSVEASSARPKSDENRLDVAFDSLDQQLSGHRHQGTHNPSGPLGHAAGAADPRSPGRKPDHTSAPGNPVFEVDDEWFGGESRAQADARAGRREIIEDLNAPELQAESAATESAPAPVFEVDDEWFADGNKTRAAKLDEQRQLAAEMGIHDVDLPTLEAPLDPAPVVDRDFEFGLDDLKALDQRDAGTAATPPADVAASTSQPPPQDLDTAHDAPVAAAMPIAPPELVESAIVPESVTAFEAPTPVETVSELKAIAPPADPRGVADDFAALLAYEQGEAHEPPTPTPAMVPAPQITEEMLDQIASHVAERLTAGLLSEQLRAALTDTVRDTVRDIVSETSERLVRDEIDRIKSQS